MKVKDLQYSPEGEKVKVTWSDDHISKYDIEFILSSQFQNFKMKHSVDTSPIFWNVSSILQNRSCLNVKLGDLCTSDTVAKDVVTSLIRYGLAFIQEVPPNITSTEMAIRRLFPLMKTFQGEMFTFPDVFLQDEVTKVKAFVEPHTDGSYYSDPMGLQAIHCIEQSGERGDIFFTDGFHIARELRQRNPKAFDILSRVHVPTQLVVKDEHHNFSAPTIRVDPITKKINQIRLNMYDRSLFNTLPQCEMQDFYESMRELLTMANHSENRWQLPLEPGTMVIFDNWRLLHGRCAYSGNRTLARGYVQRTDFLSKARIMTILE
ncbi:trimethyllysine dioxygenase, mitochondrial-like [Stomoxys calcitrans]|uniref:trimethyllysine dioxygenase, mitochondrial-like n=1 Tax=Stomoxys calcitrans TaxID=35570 RepID=UPI0027E392BF|nr:trimethyllysine dioxygenase, mitochondrial-like [Stomoxys calcitrans]